MQGLIIAIFFATPTNVIRGQLGFPLMAISRHAVAVLDYDVFLLNQNYIAYFVLAYDFFESYPIASFALCYDTAINWYASICESGLARVNVNFYTMLINSRKRNFKGFFRTTTHHRQLFHFQIDLGQLRPCRFLLDNNFVR